MSIQVQNAYRPGEWLVICDRCGFRYYSSQLQKEWTGLYTCKGPGTIGCWEPRHPQDFVRGVMDNQNVPWKRPGSDTFVDLVKNGQFDLDAEWTKGTGWSIADGVASSDGSQSGDSELKQDIGVANATTYKIDFEITVITAGAITSVSLGGTTNSDDISTLGRKTLDIKTVNTTGDLIITANSTFVGSIDNVIVRKA